MAQATVSTKGSIVIPQELREKYGIRPASRVEVLDIGGRVMILPVPDNPIRAARGTLRFRGSTLNTLQQFRRLEQQREKRKL